SSCCMMVFILLCRSSTHLALLSFPTRRSSDLLGRKPVLVGAVVVIDRIHAGLGADHGGRSGLPQRHPHGAGSCPPCQIEQCPQGGVRVRRELVSFQRYSVARTNAAQLGSCHRITARPWRDGSSPRRSGRASSTGTDPHLPARAPPAGPRAIRRRHSACSAVPAAADRSHGRSTRTPKASP